MLPDLIAGLLVRVEPHQIRPVAACPLETALHLFLQRSSSSCFRSSSILSQRLQDQADRIVSAEYNTQVVQRISGATDRGSVATPELRLPSTSEV